jgi:hypothetical protein
MKYVLNFLIIVSSNIVLLPSLCSMSSVFAIAGSTDGDVCQWSVVVPELLGQSGNSILIPVISFLETRNHKGIKSGW